MLPKPPGAKRRSSPLDVTLLAKLRRMSTTRDRRRFIALLAALSDSIRQDTALISPEFAKTGTWGDLELLARIHFEYDGVARPSQLVGLTYTTSAGVTGSLRRLEKQGLIERERIESDRRVLLARITDLGREKLQTAMPAFDDVVEKRIGYLSDDEFNFLFDFVRQQLEL